MSTFHIVAYVCIEGVFLCSTRLSKKALPLTASQNKSERHAAIRELLAASGAASQDELRRKLVRKGYRVTQATLSRDVHELQLLKGTNGYALHGTSAARGGNNDDDDSLPALEDLLASFGLRVEQARNLLVLITVTGSAQPVAAALDQAGLPEVVGTVAGDNTVLIVCPRQRQAAALGARLRTWIG